MSEQLKPCLSGDEMKAFAREIYELPGMGWIGESAILRIISELFAAMAARSTTPCPICGRSYPGQGGAYFGPQCPTNCAAQPEKEKEEK